MPLNPPIPIREKVSPDNLVRIIDSMTYPKPIWMKNESINDNTWLLSRVGFVSTKNNNNKSNIDSMHFNRLVAPNEYLTEQKWAPLLTDLKNSLLYLSLCGKVNRPKRVREILVRSASIILHANERRGSSQKKQVTNLDQVSFDDLKHYILSFGVSRESFENNLSAILIRWKSKKEIDWETLKLESGLTTREFQSLKHKLTEYLKLNHDSFRATSSYSREYAQANTQEFDLDFDLAPKKKTISNVVSQLEALYTARPAQRHKFRYSVGEIFGNGEQLFETTLEPLKTPLIPVDTALHALSSALHFCRTYGPSLRSYLHDLNKAELLRIKELGYAESTSTNHFNEIQEHTFISTPIPNELAPLNITLWNRETEKIDASYWKRGLPLPVAITLYTAAIWTILASFTSGRSTSLLSLKRDCFVQSPVDDLFDLVLRIPKRSERVELEETHRPIPDLVYDYGIEFALLVCELENRRGLDTSDADSYLFAGVLAERSVSACRYNNNDFLRCSLGMDYINYAIDLFQDWSASPLIAGKRWYPTTHQFRRLFAVLYFNFTDALGLDELSWFMGHANLDQTYHYAELSPTDEWITEAERTIAKVGSRLNEAIRGDKTIIDIVSRARKDTNINLILEDLIESMLKEHVEKTGDTVRFHKIDNERVFFYFSPKDE